MHCQCLQGNSEALNNMSESGCIKQNGTVQEEAILKKIEHDKRIRQIRTSMGMEFEK